MVQMCEPGGDWIPSVHRKLLGSLGPHVYGRTIRELRWREEQKEESLEAGTAAGALPSEENKNVGRVCGIWARQWTTGWLQGHGPPSAAVISPL